jgi:hypothetical protein
VRRWPLTVNNNKPGEFVSSSGNFFDLASYFFGRGCDYRTSPAGCPHARSCEAGFSTIRVDGCGPQATGLPVSVPGGYPTETASEATTVPQYFALGIAGDLPGGGSVRANITAPRAQPPSLLVPLPFWINFAAIARERSINGAVLIATEFHGFPPGWLFREKERWSGRFPVCLQKQSHPFPPP